MDSDEYADGGSWGDYYNESLSTEDVSQEYDEDVLDIVPPPSQDDVETDIDSQSGVGSDINSITDFDISLNSQHLDDQSQPDLVEEVSLAGPSSGSRPEFPRVHEIDLTTGDEPLPPPRRDKGKEKVRDSEEDESAAHPMEGQSAFAPLGKRKRAEQAFIPQKNLSGWTWFRNARDVPQSRRVPTDVWHIAQPDDPPLVREQKDMMNRIQDFEQRRAAVVATALRTVEEARSTAKAQRNDAWGLGRNSKAQVDAMYLWRHFPGGGAYAISKSIFLYWRKVANTPLPTEGLEDTYEVSRRRQLTDRGGHYEIYARTAVSREEYMQVKATRRWRAEHRLHTYEIISRRFKHHILLVADRRFPEWMQRTLDFARLFPFPPGDSTKWMLFIGDYFRQVASGRTGHQRMLD